MPVKPLVLLALALAGQALAGCIGNGEPASPDPSPEAVPWPWTGWATPEDAWIRPGSPIGSFGLSSLLPVGGDCTANFVFTDEARRAVFIGTAAHCMASHQLGDRVNVGKEPRNLTARLAYSSWIDMGLHSGDHDELCNTRVDVAFSSDRLCWNDFALLEVARDDWHRLNPQVLTLGGPTALGQPPAPGDVVATYGNSGYRETAGEAADARLGPVLDVTDQRFLFHSVVPSMRGDSGAPVLDIELRAVGVVIYLHLLPATTNGAANLEWLLDQAAQAGFAVTLATA